MKYQLVHAEEEIEKATEKHEGSDLEELKDSHLSKEQRELLEAKIKYYEEVK